MLNRSTRSSLVALILMATTSAALAGEARLYLAPYGMQSTLTGEGRLTGGSGTAGTDFGLEETLGVDPDVSTLGVEGWVKLLGSRLAFSYQQADLDGEETLSSSFTIDGTTYSASEQLESTIDYRRAKVMFGWDFPLKIVNVGFLAGFHAIEIDATVTSAMGITENQKLRAPIPAVGVTLGVHPIDSLAIHAEVTGFNASIAGVEATMIDGYAGVDWLLLKKFGLTAGYRYFRLEALHEDDDNRFDLIQRGPYAGIVLHL